MNPEQSANQNQTIFSQVAPTLDNSLEEAERALRQAEKAKAPVQARRKSWKFWLLIIFFGVILLLGASIIIISIIEQQPVVREPVAQPTPTIGYEDNSLSAQIKLKREELRRLELSQDSLAFPQIDKKIEIKID